MYILDQGLPAVSPEFGEYQYRDILERLSQGGRVVISEPRPSGTDSLEFARRVAAQVQELLDAGVPASRISLVGASKGAAIAIYVSHLLPDPQLSYVLLAICHPDSVAEFLQNQVTLHGSVLSIYDTSDSYAGSCQALLDVSEGQGLARRAEIVLQVGSGHGLLYQAGDEWVLPTLQWVGAP